MNAVGVLSVLRAVTSLVQAGAFLTGFPVADRLSAILTEANKLLTEMAELIESGQIVLTATDRADIDLELSRLRIANDGLAALIAAS